MQVRPPQHPALQGLVRLLWVGHSPAGAAERIIPTGGVHLVWRLDAPLRLGLLGEQVERLGVLGGPRDRAHVHDQPASRSIGVMLCTGALPAFVAEPARALAGQHVGLDAFFGADAQRLFDALGTDAPPRALERVEAFLVSRLRARPRSLEPALRALALGGSVAEAASAIQRSPRTLGEAFEAAVGLSPRVWARVYRLNRALRLDDSQVDAAEVAARAGYADLSHLCREMRDITDLTWTVWRAARTAQPNHVNIL